MIKQNQGNKRKKLNQKQNTNTVRIRKSEYYLATYITLYIYILWGNIYNKFSMLPTTYGATMAAGTFYGKIFKFFYKNAYISEIYKYFQNLIKSWAVQCFWNMYIFNKCYNMNWER